MKQIIIFLLSIIVLILGFNFYQNYKRFNVPGVEYIGNQTIDKNYHDKNVLLSYYQAIEELNGYVRMQWSSNSIDVRNPKDDDQDTKIAVAGYTKLLGVVKFYEDNLIQSAKMKKQGLSNIDIIAFEDSGSEKSEYDSFLKKKFLLNTFKTNPEKYSLKVGDYGAFVFELQKFLVKKGYNIPVDGLFRDITLKAIGEFEQKNNLLPDGKVDEVMLNYLLRD